MKNELDILKLRLQVMNPVVDYFVISEATTTFSGISKPLYYEENKEMFREFEDKIIELVGNSEKETSKYELQCSDNAAEIMYTQECKNSMSCGLTDFYFMCMEQVIEEMKAGE